MPANIKSIELRNLQIEDYKQLKNSMIESYPEMEESFWKKIKLYAMAKFPEGQLVIVDGIVVGSTSLLVTEDFALKHGPIKLSQEISRSQLTILMEVLYGIDVLLILNIEA
jgi:hypothetical protein